MALTDNGASFPYTNKTGYFANRYILGHASEKHMLIPAEEIDQWVEAWPKIKAYLTEKGFTSETIDAAWERLKMLDGSEYFDELPAWREGSMWVHILTT